MATRRAPNVPLFDAEDNLISPPVAQISAPPQDAPESLEPALLAVLEQLGETEEEARVIAYRVTEDKRKPDAYLRQFSPSEFVADGLETLKRVYGGGLFKISVYGNDGRFLKNPIINIETPPDWTPPSAQPVSPPDPNSQILTVMQSGFEKMATMFSAALSQLSPPQQSRMDMLREMALFKEMFSPPPNQSDPQSLIETLLRGIEMGKDLGPKGESTENDVLMGMIESFGKPIIEAAMSGASHSQSVPVSRPVSPSPPVSHPSALPHSPPQSPPEPQMQNPILTQAINFLVSQAARNNDPLTYANMILDQADEEAIQAFLGRPDWFERLCEMNPRAVNYAEWFTELRSSTLDLLTDEPDPVIDPPISPPTGPAPVPDNAFSNGPAPSPATGNQAPASAANGNFGGKTGYR